MTRIGVLLLMILFAWGITAQQRPQPSADVPAAPSAPAPPAAAPGQPDVFGVTPRVPGRSRCEANTSGSKYAECSCYSQCAADGSFR
jgi:hypothetical protein